MLLTIFSVFLLLVYATATKKQPPVKGNPPEKPARAELDEKCGDDIQKYCSTTGNLLEIYCLYSNRDEISETCNQYLGSTTIGGCNEDAQKLCGQYTSVTDIMSCLTEHKDELTVDCLKNVESHAQEENPLRKMQEEMWSMTKAITFFSIILLCIPMTFVIIVSCCMYNLNRTKNAVLLESPEVWKQDSAVLQLIGGQHTSTHNQDPFANQTNPDWRISFYQINYWAVEMKHWYQPRQVTRKKILNDISGELKPRSVTAVMGPSGGGKTTLLKLISGQMFTGEFAGKRAINNFVFRPHDYDQIMRRQGYVSQHDSLIASLTVWQTLMFAAMLRLPEEMSQWHKLSRAAHIMHELGLSSIAHSVIGTQQSVAGTAGSSTAVQRGISGGQRRRLSIALEMISNPHVLLADEPTSGLDSASSLKIVRLLHDLCHRHGRTVCLTIHQPRTEVFELFDFLLLLGTGGYIVYYGETKHAVALLSSAPIVRHGHSALMAATLNPGDFIIDILGLSENQEAREDELLLSPSSASPLHKDGHGDDDDEERKEMAVDSFVSLPLAVDEEQSGFNTPPRDQSNNAHLLNQQQPYTVEVRSAHLHNHFISSTAYQTLLTSLDTLRKAPPLSSNDKLSLMDRISHAFGMLSNSVISRSNRRSRDGSQYNQLQTNDDQDSTHSSSALPSMFTATMTDDDNKTDIEMISFSSQPEPSRSSLMLPEADEVELHKRQLQYFLPLSYRRPASFITTIWVQYARRLTAFWPHVSEITWLGGQILFVSIVVSITFSYDVSSELERPYQSLMLISIVSLYGMILQYLLLIPEHMMERSTHWSEHRAGYVSHSSHVIASMLTEIPRAVLQCCILLSIVYHMHPLNPNKINKHFAFVCFIVGVCSWQALIHFCATMTDFVSVAYSMAFLVLGSGTLFGGLLVRLNKIPTMFRFLYYVSVAAVTQRAMIANDLQCCYLTATCNSLKEDPLISMQSPAAISSPSSQQFMASGGNGTMSTYCPPGLQFTGDGSDLGNLGRAYLWVCRFLFILFSCCCLM